MARAAFRLPPGPPATPGRPSAPGALSLDTLQGLTVTTKPGSGLEEELRSRGAVVKVQNDLSKATSPIAAELWEARGLGFTPTDIVLRKQQHVLAVRQGENALLMRLEQFLFKHQDAAALEARLWEASPHAGPGGEP